MPAENKEWGKKERRSLYLNLMGFWLVSVLKSIYLTLKGRVVNNTILMKYIMVNILSLGEICHLTMSRLNRRRMPQPASYIWKRGI
jgi:hypothetical protein